MIDEAGGCLWEAGGNRHINLSPELAAAGAEQQQPEELLGAQLPSCLVEVEVQCAWDLTEATGVETRVERGALQGACVRVWVCWCVNVCGYGRRRYVVGMSGWMGIVGVEGRRDQGRGWSA